MELAKLNDIASLHALLKQPKDIVILSHRNPDGDALGSTLGLMHFLKNFAQSAQVIYPSEYPVHFEWMPGIQHAKIFDLEPELCTQLVKDAALIFCLDFNALDRIDKLGEIVQLSNVPKVMIDHHIDPEPFADYTLSDIAASSTSELIFEFIVQLGLEKWMDKPVAECLYTGIVTDTGSFRFSNTDYTFEVVAKLKRCGIDDYEIQNKLNNNFPAKHLHLLGHCLANRMELFKEYGAGLIHLTKEDYKQFDIQRGDTEGIVNYLLMIDFVKFGCLIMEQPNIIKVSLRSKGDLNVQRIARMHFNGGGHKNASGGYLHTSLNQALKTFREVLPKL